MTGFGGIQIWIRGFVGNFAEFFIAHAELSSFVNLLVDSFCDFRIVATIIAVLVDKLSNHA